MNPRYWIPLLLLAASVVVATPALRAQGEGRDRVLLESERNTIDLFQRHADSVVFITNNQVRRNFWNRNVSEIPVGSGSGFVWDQKGHVVTNYHVIRGGDSFSVTLADGSAWEAKFVGADPNKDLAVLRIEAPRKLLNPVERGRSTGLLVGQKVLAIGNPFGLDQTLTTGIISALGREIRSVAGTTISDVIQTDASINPGNSGGPLLDSAGRLIGVNTAIFSTSGASAGIGFAVPVNTVERIVPQLIDHGRVKRPGLGVRLATDADSRRLGIQGVIVRDVELGGPAAEAGIQPLMVDRNGRTRIGDVIVGIEDREIRTYDDLYQALDQHEPGDRVTVKLLREGRTVEAKVRLTDLNQR